MRATALLVGLVGAAIVTVVPTADAQLCMGAQSFTAQPMRLTGLVVLDDATNGAGGGLTLGRTGPDGRGMFGSLGATVTDFGADDVGLGIEVDPVVGIGLSAGWQNPLAERGLSLCPTMGVSYANGPDVTVRDVNGTVVSEFALSSFTFTGGAWLGGVLSTGSRLQLLPAVGLHLAYAVADAEDESGTIVFEGDDDEFFTVVSAALGFGLGERWLIRPELSLPIGYAGSDASIAVGVSYNFGGR